MDPASITDWDSLRDAAIKLTKWDGDKLVQSGFSLKDVGPVSYTHLDEFSAKSIVCFQSGVLCLSCIISMGPPLFLMVLEFFGESYWGCLGKMCIRDRPVFVWRGNV